MHRQDLEIGIRYSHKYTDSVTVKRRCSAYTYESSVLHECICNLRQLELNNHVTLQSFSSHQESEGNEEVDKQKQTAKKQQKQMRRQQKGLPLAEYTRTKTDKGIFIRIA